MRKLFNLTALLLSLCLTITINGQESDCGNGIDDDNDGFIDCGDTDCYGSTSCDDAFTCTNILYQVVSRTLNRLDPLTGKYEALGEASANYNGAGFNVQDGYIYGIKSSSDGKHLWRINNQGKETDLGVIAGFSGRTYVGDFDENGNLYTYNSGSNATLSYVDVDSDNPMSVVTTLIRENGAAAPSAADITYNPRFKKFYGLSGSHELFELDPEASTMRILGDFSASINVGGSFGAAWSDVAGYSYFANNKTGQIYRFTFSENGEVQKAEYVALGQPTNSNDGIGCFLSLPPFETSCTDGIDNDGDGLTDCDDPDCANTGICPAIEVELRSIDIAGPLSIIPFHLQMVNNSNADALDFIIKTQMPDGFSFLSDTLEYSTNSTFTSAQQPVEGIRNTLIWDGLSIPVGDTIMISFSVLVDQSIANGTYDFLIESMGVVQSPYSLTHPIDIDESIYYSAEPYVCEPAFYQVFKKRGEPNVLGKLNPQSAEYDQIAIIDHQANGLGYDINSGYAYGSDGKKFIRIDPEGNVVYQGFEFEKNVFVGDVDESGNWYGKVGGNMVKVNIANNSIEATYPSQGMPGWDMAYNKDGQFYAVHSQTLYQFNTTTNTKQTIGQLTGDAVPTSGHGAQWTGLDGYHYISNNKTGQIYRINVESKEATLCMVTESNLQFNDGFACPTELPVVFQYDFGDNIKMPIARQLVYEQDLGNDDVPDYSMVWLGTGVSHESFDPSDETASGDTKDDGFKMEDTFTAGEINTAKIDLNANRPNLDAYWGIWIDWNNDGEADEYFSGQETISGSTIVEIPVTIPAGISGQRIGVRVRTSVSEIKEENFSGDIYEPGEVEDYIITIDNSEICANGIDDDKDGLLDCDDTECVDKCKSGETGSAGNGGLESNERLNDKITKSMFQRRMRGQSTVLSRRGLSRFQPTNNRAVGPLQLSDLIPVDKIPNTETFINSPQHLINLTNAVDLFAVDVFEDDKRVAAMLSLETVDGVYEHTKYICDRLTGSQVLDIFKYAIDGTNEFIIAKLELPDGNIEYSVSFSIRETSNGHMNLESYWNLGDYTNDTRFMNFQIWANNTSNLFSLTTGIIDLIKQNATIDNYLIGDAPSVFVKSGSIDKGNLHLNIVNKIGVEYLETAGNFSLTETMEQTDYNNVIPLTGALNEEITLAVGDVYYMGLAFYHPDFQVEDEIFLANGAWGYSIEGSSEEVTTYEVLPTQTYDDNHYEVQRAVKASGQVLDFINFYRSFDPRFTKRDLDQYQSLSFTGSGNATLEIAILKEGAASWEEQGKTIIELSSEDREYTLGKSFFKNINNLSSSWDDVYMIVVNVLGDHNEVKPFDMMISDFYFGHKTKEQSYVVFSDVNVIGPKVGDHVASTSDGTDLGSISMSADFKGVSVPLTIANFGSGEVVVDDIEIIDPSGTFEILGFEPGSVESGDSLSFELNYRPGAVNVSSDIQVNIYMDTDEGYTMVPVNVKAQSACVLTDHISTDDIKDETEREIIAAESIASDANVTDIQKLTYSANQEISLTQGFELAKGGTLQLVIEDKCSVNQ